MRKVFAALACAAFLAGTGGLTATHAKAAQLIVPAAPLTAPAHAFEGKVVQVQRRRGRRWRRGRRRGWGPGGVAAGIAGAIIAGALISEAAKARHRRSGAWERCMDDYRSFDPDTGTIVTYDGDVILCPYLR